VQNYNVVLIKKYKVIANLETQRYFRSL